MASSAITNLKLTTHDACTTDTGHSVITIAHHEEHNLLISINETVNYTHVSIVYVADHVVLC